MCCVFIGFSGHGKEIKRRVHAPEKRAAPPPLGFVLRVCDLRTQAPLSPLVARAVLGTLEVDVHVRVVGLEDKKSQGVKERRSWNKKDDTYL